MKYDMEKLKGLYVIFPYGSTFKGCHIEEETPKKFTFDLWKNANNGMKRPEPIMKNTIIYITDNHDEAVKVLKDLQEKASLINQLQKELISSKHHYQSQIK